MDIKEMIAKMPKVELHVHLDGSLRVETILELAEKDNINLPTNNFEELKKMVQVGENCKSLVEYLKAFDITLMVLQKRDALKRVAFELAEDAAKENVKYMEVRYSPILHTNQGLSLTDINDAVLEGLHEAEKMYDIKTGVIICGMRHMTPDISLRLAELSVAYKNRGVIAFDLAGAEADFPAKDHIKAFYLMLNNNVNCTLHAGEAYGAESISQAIHYCGAHRLGHGTRLKEDGDLLNYVNDHRIPLEICLSSNIQTKSVNNLESHPFKFYYDYGLRVTLNTDNRLVSDTTLTKEFILAQELYNLKPFDLRQITINSFKSSFLPYREKVKMLNKYMPEINDILMLTPEERNHY